MKFENSSSFFNALLHTRKENLLPLCYLIVKDEFERIYYVEKTKKALLKLFPQYKEEYFSGIDASMFKQGNLFSRYRLIIIDNTEKIKGDLNYLTDFDNHLILLSDNKIDNRIYQDLKKSILCLDLTNEKVWNKKKRYQLEIIEQVKTAGKKIEFDTAGLLLDKIGILLFGSVHNETKKLCRFVGNKILINRKDVELICSKLDYNNFWKIAEQLIWYSTVENIVFHNRSDFTYLMKCVRYNLYLGIEIYLKKPVNLGKKKLDLYTDRCQDFGIDYFIKGLSLLFETNVNYRYYKISDIALWELLSIKLLSTKYSST